MWLFIRRALQVIGLCGVVALGGLVWRQSIDNSFIEACVFGMMALTAIAVVAGFGDGGSGAIALMPVEQGADSVVRVAEQRFAADIALVVKLLQSHLTANTNYSETLTRANADLPQLRSTEEIRTVVLTLIDENRKVQAKIDELSKSLDESVNKFEKLRSNLAEANDKAMRDALTGLGNRRFFDQELSMALEDDPVVCLMMCDLDNFKAINDKFGHAVGDMVLKQFADILNAAARRDDLAARLGGEEFAMVMPSVSPVDAGRVADHIRRQLEAKKWMLGGSVALGKVTASFGVARRRSGETAADFFKRADAALYRAKSDGRNRVVLDLDA
ncbi:MAG: diguanylate cyclase [Bradyrhizobium sp.]|nr:MAG: diguanylate cyclase [Bradyrhizobium sp.]